MTETRDLLVEVGTEELPPRSLGGLSRAFREAFRDGLVKAGLHHGEIHVYATPRRLALLIRDLVTHQAERVTERRGPALALADPARIARVHCCTEN